MRTFFEFECGTACAPRYKLLMGNSSFGAGLIVAVLGSGAT